MNRGIFLVANLNSQQFCENLIYSIRESGCKLPIRIIHFGGKEINSSYLLKQGELLYYENFSEDAKHFIANLRSVLTDCPTGFLYRFLALFSDWDEFIYSDNDIVALMNWEKLFEYLPDNDIVHADEEYITEGRFNHNNPNRIKELFGTDALEKAITAGHFVMKRSKKIIDDLNLAIEWYKTNTGIAKKHDQALLHVAALLGNWKALNLCKPPHNWLSSWAGDYQNSLQIIHALGKNGIQHNISHIHYSGSSPAGNRAIEDLLFSNLNDKQRMQELMTVAIKFQSGLRFIQDKRKRILRRLRLLANK